MQAQKQSKPRPAASFQLHESEGMQDLLPLMQNMSVGGGGELPQANGDLGGHAHATEGITLLYSLGDTDLRVSRSKMVVRGASAFQATRTQTQLDAWQERSMHQTLNCFYPDAFGHLTRAHNWCR